MPKNRGWGMFRRGRRPCQSANASSRKTEAGGFEGEDRWRNIPITLIDPATGVLSAMPCSRQLGLMTRSLNHHLRGNAFRLHDPARANGDSATVDLIEHMLHSVTLRDPMQPQGGIRMPVGNRNAVVNAKLWAVLGIMSLLHLHC